MNEKDVAVIGVGYWGKNLARNYYELGALHTLCDHNLYHLAYYQSHFKSVQCTQDYQQVLENPEIQKVVIAAPTAQHYTLAKQALWAGKDVFVEKAMCESVDEAQELVELATQNQKTLMVGHLLHYHPGIVKLKEIIESKTIGNIYHCSFNRLNFGSIGAEKSALWAFAPHDISLLLALIGQRSLVEFQVRHKRFFSEKYIDQSWLHFEFSQNMSADIQVGWAFPSAERKFTVLGDEGMIIFDDLKPHEEKVTLWKNKIHVQKTHIQFDAQEKVNIPFEEKEPLKEECKHFLACCEMKSKPITSGEEGLEVMKILEAAKEESICMF